MDFLTGTLCMCIGSAVAWLIALYTERGVYSLFWNTLFGMAGTVLCALAIAWIAPTLGVVGLVIAGPICAVLMIVAGHGIKRALQRWLAGVFG